MCTHECRFFPPFPDISVEGFHVNGSSKTLAAKCVNKYWCKMHTLASASIVCRCVKDCLCQPVVTHSMTLGPVSSHVSSGQVWSCGYCLWSLQSWLAVLAIHVSLLLGWFMDLWSTSCSGMWTQRMYHLIPCWSRLQKDWEKQNILTHLWLVKDSGSLCSWLMLERKQDLFFQDLQPRSGRVWYADY